MAEETTAETRVFALLSRIEERQEAGFEQMRERFHALENQFGQRLARLEGGFEQVNARMSKVEADIGDLRKDMRQVLFVIIGTWVTIMVALLLKGA